jgi:hypothetical protein
VPHDDIAERLPGTRWLSPPLGLSAFRSYAPLHTPAVMHPTIPHYAELRSGVVPLKHAKDLLAVSPNYHQIPWPNHSGAWRRFALWRAKGDSLLPCRTPPTPPAGTATHGAGAQPIPSAAVIECAIPAGPRVAASR